MLEILCISNYPFSIIGYKPYHMFPRSLCIRTAVIIVKRIGALNFSSFLRDTPLYFGNI